jgi:hypothetical protein
MNTGTPHGSTSQVSVGNTGIIGINGFARTPSLNRKTSQQDTANPLYARVDRSKKKKNRDSSSGNSSSDGCSPICSPTEGGASPTKTLIDKFNNMEGEHKRVIRVPAAGNSPSSSASSDNLTHNGGSPRFRPTTLYPSLNRNTPATHQVKEPMYATIGSKRMLANVRAADV